MDTTRQDTTTTTTGHTHTHQQDDKTGDLDGAPHPRQEGDSPSPAWIGRGPKFENSRIRFVYLVYYVFEFDKGVLCHGKGCFILWFFKTQTCIMSY